ncbi:MAG: hypothetical protein ISR65_17580 [Bacteriovoracaceae bacterium]|nr:hypothetical protein [Bacteriovoracaceae bacterium]
MKCLILVLGCCIFNLTYASDNFYYQDIKYTLTKVEKKYFVHPSSYQATIDDVSGLTKNDCTELAQYVSGSEWLYQKCIEKPELSICQVARDGILFKSKEEHFQSPVLLTPTNRSWEVILKKISVNEQALIEFAASKYNIEEENIILKINPKIEIGKILIIERSDTSLLDKVGKIVPVIRGSLDLIRVVDGLLVSNNRFLACDLENEAINIKSYMSQILSYTDSIAKENLDLIWDLYNDVYTTINLDSFKNVPNLVQAALIGYKMGVKIKKSKLNEKGYKFLQLLEDLFVIEGGVLELKHFDSKEELRSKQYADLTYSKQITTSWSL